MSDIQPPIPDVEPPTVESLATLVAALTRRVALLEARCGYADDTTITDLEPHEALSLVGGSSTRLEQAMANIKAQKELDAQPVDVAPVDVTPVQGKG